MEAGTTTPPTGPSPPTSPPGQSSSSSSALLVVTIFRRYYVQSTFQGYHELDFSTSDRNTIYWHYTIPDQDQEECFTCILSFLIKPTLMEIVETLNPGQPALPDWVYNGAILGVQGGTETMLGVLEQARDHGVRVSAMWIQDWSGKITTDFGTRVFWNWRWNETWYPDLDFVVKELDDQGIKVTVYLTGRFPFLHFVFVSQQSAGR